MITRGKEICSFLHFRSKGNFLILGLKVSFTDINICFSIEIFGIDNFEE